MFLHVCITSVRYEWRTTDWGDCRILPLLSQQDRRLANISTLCGGGIQTRKTYCVQVPDDSAPHHRKEGKKTAFITFDPGLAGSMQWLKRQARNKSHQTQWCVLILAVDINYLSESSRILCRLCRRKTIISTLCCCGRGTFKKKAEDKDYHFIPTVFPVLQYTIAKALNSRDPLLCIWSSSFYLQKVSGFSIWRTCKQLTFWCSIRSVFSFSFI